MKYIKHAGKFYKEVKLEELSKDELVDLIKNAIEVKNDVVYIDRYVKTYPWARDLWYSNVGNSQVLLKTPNIQALDSMNDKKLMQLAQSLIE